MAPRSTGEPAKAPAWKRISASAAVMRPSFLTPILTVDAGARGRAGGPEHLLARHHHLDRPAGLARQRQRHRLDEDRGLAAEAAADLRGVTRSFDTSMPSSAAQVLRIM